MLSQGRDQRTIRVTRVSEMKGICVTGGGGGGGGDSFLSMYRLWS